MYNNSYFLYCRKSSEDSRQALSIPAQLRELKEFAVKNDLRIIKTFQEEKSARIPNKRKEFNEMLYQIKQGKATKILCWHTNRLSRNPQESGVLQQMITDETIEEIRTPFETITKDTNDVMLGVSFGGNSQYSKELSYNTKRGMREKAYRGEWLTGAPPFYINFGDKKGSKNIKPDPETSKFYLPWIRRIIKERLTTREATRVLRELGVRAKSNKFYSSSMVQRLLRNPMYYGLLQYGDIEKIGTWEPLIDKCTWDDLQMVLDNRTKPYFTKHNHAYSKLIKCSDCGGFLIGVTKTKKSGKSYTYYSVNKSNHPECKCLPIKEMDLDELFCNDIEKLEMSESQAETIREYTIKRLEGDKTSNSFVKIQYDKEIAEVNENLDGLLKLRLAEEITKEDYKLNKSKNEMRLSELEELIRDLNLNRSEFRNEVELILEDCLIVKKVFEHGNNEEKRRIVLQITQDISFDGNSIRWNFKKPYQTMVKFKNEPKSENWGGRWGSNI